MNYYLYLLYNGRKYAFETNKRDFDCFIDEITKNEPIFKQETFTLSKELKVIEYCVRTCEKELDVIGYTIERCTE